MCLSSDVGFSVSDEHATCGLAVFRFENAANGAIIQNVADSISICVINPFNDICMGRGAKHLSRLATSRAALSALALAESR
jgi:hypothetical protein